MRQFTLSEVDFYEVSGPVNLNRLAALYDLVQRPDLKYPIFTPGLPRRVAGSTDLLAVARSDARTGCFSGVIEAGRPRRS